jgi:hypothetical protein
VGRPPTSPDRLAGRVVVRQSRGVPDDGVDGGTRAVGVQLDERIAECGEAEHGDPFGAPGRRVWQRQVEDGDSPPGLPADADRDDAELAGLVAGDELAWGSLEEAERFLGLALRGSASVPAGRRAQWQVLLGVVRL